MDQGWAAVIAGVVGLVSGVGGAVVGGVAAVRGARLGAETNADAVRGQVVAQAANEHAHWVRQERQKAYREVLDAYTIKAVHASKFITKLEKGEHLTEAEKHELESVSGDLSAACSRLSLIGPERVYIAGSLLRDCQDEVTGTLEFWSEDLETILPEDVFPWGEVLSEERDNSYVAYHDFMRESRKVIIYGTSGEWE
ncbi:hypothetical protein [Streptomyces sp. NPDC001787]|uniref:hypothetical protein n=1 Tax=Streptomyces sp. NPDC001787 TaxID=3154523 RepID=UPI00332424DE